MKYTITTYDNNGNEIVSRNYTDKITNIMNQRDNWADQIESMVWNNFISN